MLYNPFSTDKYLSYCAEIEKYAFLMYDCFASSESDLSLSLIWQNLAEEELDMSSPKNKNSFLNAKQQPCLFTTEVDIYLD